MYKKDESGKKIQNIVTDTYYKSIAPMDVLCLNAVKTNIKYHFKIKIIYIRLQLI